MTDIAEIADIQITKMNKGQITITTALITAGGAIIASILVGWFSSSARVGVAETNIAIVQEREGNHYAEVQKQLTEISNQLDRISEKVGVRNTSTK